jgi:hypothetical protein
MASELYGTTRSIHNRQQAALDVLYNIQLCSEKDDPAVVAELAFPV